MTTKTEAANLSETLATAAREAEAAAALERQAAEARRKAQEAQDEAERRQRAAREAWAHGAIETAAAQRDDTIRALTAAWAALDAATETGDLGAIVDAWRGVWLATAALHGLDALHARASEVLGRPSRPPKDVRPDFAGDLARGMNRWAGEQVQAATEAVGQSLAAATSGKGGA
jgi:hypothetical protein